MNFNDRSLVDAFLSIFGATLVTLVISVAFTPLLVRVLGPDQYGNYAFVLSVLAMSMIVANSGVTRGAKKYLPEEGRPTSWQSDVFGFYARVSLLLVALVSAPIFLLAQWDFFGLLAPELVPLMQLMAVVVVCKQLYWFAKNALQGLGYERYSEPIRVLQRGSFACLALALAALGYGVAGVLVGYVLSLVLGLGAALYYLRDVLDLTGVVRRRLSLPRRQLLTFNLLSVVFLFLMESLYNSDVILLRLLAGETVTGYYKGALVVAQLIWLLPKALQSLLLHSTSNYWSAEQYERIQTVSSLTARLILVVSCLLAAGLVVLADEFLPLYFGPEFAAAVVPTLLLLPGVIGFAVARPVNAIVQGSGELGTLVAASGGAAAINLVLNLLLIPPFGMHGAAVATSVGYGSLAVFSTFASRSVGFDPVDDVRLLRILGATALSIAVMYPVDRVVENPFVALAVVPVVGTAAYALVIFRTGAVTPQEVETVTDRLPRSVATPTNKLLSVIT